MSNAWFYQVVIVAFSTICLLQTNSNGAAPKGHDFTVAADANYVPGELLVRFAPKANGKQRTAEEKNQILSSLDGATLQRVFKILPGASVVQLPPEQTVEEALKTFNRADGILYAEPNYKVRAVSVFPNDPNFPQLWGMHNMGQTGGTEDADIDAPEAWNITTGTSEIIVAVLDTGIDYNHPDLAENMWVNQAELNGEPNVDDDENGYVDDIYGYDFCNNDTDPIDDHYHGTHVAGTIGAIGNNAEGVTGVCWNIKIMVLKFLAADGYGDTDDAISAIEYATQTGAKVLNNSWGGGGYSQLLKDTIDAADANGVLFIAAAGNDTHNNDNPPHNYPSSYDCNNIISVMATDKDDDWPSFSNFGADSVDLGAPGTSILSTFPTYETDAMIEKGYSTNYETISGTSMSTPHVAGACALLWSVNPSLSHREVKQILLNTVDKLDSLDGYCVAGGRLNLYNAVVEATKHQSFISKVDNLDPNDPNDCVLPGDYIDYTIYYSNPVNDLNDPNYLGTLHNVKVTDYLPEEINDVNASDGGYYNPVARTVTWNIGPLSPGEENSVTLSVRVNELAEPLGTITNICVIEANEIKPTTAVEITDVNSWNPGIIYVNSSAGGSNTGMSWDYPYVYLQSALKRAQQGCGNQIWVAAGKYNATTSFELVDGVSMYGGFAGNETSLDQRNCSNNITTLSGDINGDGSADTYYVVRASDINEGLVDGFTITKGDASGIYCENSKLTIQNNTLTENRDGIKCDDSNVTIIGCMIKTNNGIGITCENSSSVDIETCNIADNDEDGIFCDGWSVAVIINNWIHNNGYGITFQLNTSQDVVVRNNTITDNNSFDESYGIGDWWQFSFTNISNIRNCIIWGNTSSVGEYGTYDINFSCVQDGYPGTGNIDSDPCFINDPNDPNNYHLGPNSPCIDSGDPDLILDDPNETDIDGEDRIMDGDANGNARVDMGADEYYWSRADYNRDELVNFIDYAYFANAWLCVDANISLDDDNDVDCNDLALFCEDWLWEAAWKEPFAPCYGRSMGTLGGTKGSYSSESAKNVQAQLEPEPQQVNIEEIAKWLEELWLTDEGVREQISEDKWLEFIESVKSEIQ